MTSIAAILERAAPSTAEDVGKARGEDAEYRVIRLVRIVFQREPWFYDVRRADRYEDREGIDIVVRSSVGDLFLQVKSSAARVCHGEPSF